MMTPVSVSPSVCFRVSGICVRASLAAVAVILLFATSDPASAAVLTKTDASWKVTPTNPGAVPWNTDPAFNDSGWQNATVLGSAGAPYAASTIWSSGGANGNEPLLWGRHTFTVSGALTSAVLTYGCDDDCTIWVNGVQVVNDNNGLATGGTADVLAQLQQGSNLIAFSASDNVSFGLQHAAWIQVDGEGQVSAPPPGSPAAIPTMGAWTLALLAGLLAALAGFGYRQRAGRKA